MSTVRFTIYPSEGPATAEDVVATAHDIANKIAGMSPKDMSIQLGILDEQSKLIKALVKQKLEDMGYSCE